MTTATPVLALQTDALIGLLQREAATGCERERQLASERRRDLLRAAYRDARAQLHTAVADERTRRTNAIAQARAAAATRDRQAAERSATLGVRTAFACLPGALTALWRDAAQRAAWSLAAIALAAQSLPLARWEVDCAADMTVNELEMLGRRVREAGVQDVALDRTTSLAAGLVIRSAGATLDATIMGLTADRHAIEALLHAAWRLEIKQ